MNNLERKSLNEDLYDISENSIISSYNELPKLESNLKEIFYSNSNYLKLVIGITDPITSAHFEIFLNMYKDIEAKKIWFFFALSHSPLLFEPFSAYACFDRLNKNINLRY